MLRINISVNTSSDKKIELNPSRRNGAWIEVFFIFVLFFLFANEPTPGVNEAHYLNKAKHYWNPSWCVNDPFLESSDAHLVFYWTFGWVTRFCSLEETAWIGRVLTWGLMAWAWQRLSVAMSPARMASILSAAFFLIFLKWCHMAGEWVVGGVEAKGFAYVFVLLGIEGVVRGRWRAVWPLLGAGASFHVLVGGWGVVAAAVVWLLSRKERMPLLEMFPYLILGGGLSLPGLLPAIELTLGVDPVISAEASRIYVFERLPHHLVPDRFRFYLVQRHLALIVGWLVMVKFSHSLHRREAFRKIEKGGEAESLFTRAEPSEEATVESPSDDAALERLSRFVLGALLISISGGVVRWLTMANEHTGASLLRYYWFRLGDFALPMGAALSMIFLLSQLHRLSPKVWEKVVLVVTVACVAILGWHHYEQNQRFSPSSDQEIANLDWQDVCCWVADNSTPEDRFFTPRDQKTFKWYAGRSEVVCWKDIPQDAASIVAWRKRMVDCFGEEMWETPLRLSEDEMLDLADQYDFQYIILQQDIGVCNWPFFVVYSNDRYVVLEVPHRNTTIRPAEVLP